MGLGDTFFTYDMLWIFSTPYWKNFGRQKWRISSFLAKILSAVTLFFLYKQPEASSSLKSCLNFSRFLGSKLLKIPWFLANLPQNSGKKHIQYIFKQLVIFEPQKLLHFSRAWAQVAYILVACMKKSVLDIVDHKIVHEDDPVVYQRIDKQILITASAWRNASNAASGGVGLMNEK